MANGDEKTRAIGWGSLGPRTMKNMIVVWAITALVVLLFGSLISYVIWCFIYKWH